VQLSLRSRVVDWALAGLLIVLPALVLRASLARGTPSPLDVALLRITAPLEAGVSWVVEGIGGVWSRYIAVVDVERENRELRADNAALRDQLSVMTRRAFDTAALEDLVAVKHTRTADTLGARVIGAPLTPQFRVVRLQLDRGDHEVRPGQAVIGDGGPIGAIDKVYGSYADVVLISDPASSIEVVVPRTGGRGIVTGLGRADSYACKLEWLERSQKADARVVVGDDVVTTGLGATFPAGLVVGKVSKIVHDDGMFQEVEVEPAVDVSRVRAVLVLLSSDAAPDPDAKAKKKSEPAFGARPL
jgi:rod shape-determining protein MreC